MKRINHSIGKAGLAAAMILSLAGCVTRTVYVTQTPAEPVVVSPPPVEPPPPVVAPAPAPTVVVIRTENDFYEPLRPHGEWIVVSPHGRVWRPSRVEAGWRPYANGHWHPTDAGWYWVSDEPWAWATYHYGRWDLLPRFGWVWVPQTQWAPAWVSWREGAGYVGWAPLPPSARITVSGTVEFHDHGPRFVFVEQRRLIEPVRPRTVIVNNTTVVNRTVNITRIKVVNKTVINEGPRRDTIERASGRRLNATPVRELRERDEAPVIARRRGDHDRRPEPPAAARTPERPPRAEPSRPGRPAPAVAPSQPARIEARTPERAVRPPETPAAAPAPAPATAGSKPHPLAKPAARPVPATPAQADKEKYPGSKPAAAKPEVKPVAKPAAKPEPKPAPGPRPTAKPPKVEQPHINALLQSGQLKSPKAEAPRGQTQKNDKKDDKKDDKSGKKEDKKKNEREEKGKPILTPLPPQ